MLCAATGYIICRSRPGCGRTVVGAGNRQFLCGKASVSRPFVVPLFHTWNHR